ncbi:hypothetical protein CTI12_AA118650 [Artemisia annua]|uniref:Replication factor-A protein 1 N-terminal domain-containing protein n=1 Tax=Artemisia annua TaxID=35608 RepID=A0A2U1PS90_ARTAN|nr:hypothetical protein CTI12_AA118650 [Artemisia annua]
MGVNLTSGAISKIVTGKCTEKPVVQVMNIGRLTITIDNKQWYTVWLSDGSFWQFGLIADDIFISNKLQKGSIVLLTNFQLTQRLSFKCELISKGEIVTKSGILVSDLNVIHTKCGIIGDPKLLPDNETPLAVRSTPTIPDKDQIHATSHHVAEPPSSKQKQGHVDSHLNENIDDSRHHVEEPPTSKQKPSTSTQNCSSHSPTQNKKRKLQSSDDIISGFGKDISKLVSMIVERTIEDGLGACYKKLGTLEEGVSKMTKSMMEKSKEVDAGLKKLETLEEDVSKLTKMMIEKNKEDVVGFKKLETLEEVLKMTKLMMEKSKEVDAGFKKLETLKEDVSKMTKLMMEKSKEVDAGLKKLEKLEEDVFGTLEEVLKMTKLMMEKSKEVDAGFKKLETLKEDVSKMTKLMMEKSKEVDAGLKKLEKLEEDVSRMMIMMMEKNKVDVGFKKLETLEEHVSKLAKMMMDKNKENDMVACFEKLDKIGWVAQDPMYDTAILLFGQSADYRKLWLHLKPESCGNWVKNAGSMFGLLD